MYAARDRLVCPPRKRGPSVQGKGELREVRLPPRKAQAMAQRTRHEQLMVLGMVARALG